MHVTTTNFHRGLRLLPISVLLLILSACTGIVLEETPDTSSSHADSLHTDSLHADCPDLTGEWRAEEYEALSVLDDGSHQELPNLSMQLKIDEQVGCHFSATNIWTNGEIGGTEVVGGIINPNGDWVTILEVGEHPVGGSTGRVFGRLLDENHMSWEYAAYAADGSRATVFSTILAQAEATIIREECPDLTGVWSSTPYDVLNVLADGSSAQQMGTSNTLEVVHQDACHFRAINSWTNGELGGSEHVAGVLHSDGNLITMLEVGEHPDQGTRAYIRAKLANDNRLEWDYAGLSDDATKGQAFATVLSRDGEVEARQECPDMTGTWSSAHWDGLLVRSDGNHETRTHEFKEIVVEEQIGCTLKAVLTHGPQTAGEESHSESLIGVMSAEDGVVTMRVVAPHPEDGMHAIITTRMLDVDTLIAEYTGVANDGSEGFVYVLDLTRK